MIPILTILCGLAILFAGGCVIMTVGLGMLPLAAIPGGIVALNVLVILAIWRRRPPSFFAFVVLAGLDLLIATLLFWALAAATGSAAEADLLPMRGAAALAVVMLLKGVLTLAAAARLRAVPQRANAEDESPGHDAGG